MKNKLLKQQSSNHFIDIIITLSLVLFAWIFFRANTISEAFVIIEKIFTQHDSLFIDQTTLVYSLLGIAILLMKELKDEVGFKISFSKSSNIFVRYVYYLAMLTIILLFGVFDGGQFIYFQF